MKYFLVAGEASGDLHGANLIRGILKADPGAEFRCWGGDKMHEAGAQLLMHYRAHAIMGFVNVLLNLRIILRNILLCKKHIIEYQPDVVILIDYPGFNLKIAEFAKSSGFRVFYYISPKLWAWNESRIKKIRRFTDRMFVILPFEVEFYAKHGIEVKYFGNPLVDEIEKWKEKQDELRRDIRKEMELDDRQVIAILPGSREHEIKYILPEMLKVIDHFPEYNFVIAGVSTVSRQIYKEIIGNVPVKILYDSTYNLLSVSVAALVKSGTSTLEAALFDVPQVVCYKGDAISFAIARHLVKVRHISLVNLIMGREVVRELIQFLLTEKNLVESLGEILPGGKERERMLADYRELKKMLGPAGASERTASEMVACLLK
ncbi:MAG TPA: lipid-A-disaccharide synthase [Bacteroidales bacterium]|nr:lipid-A-disaccharide synthase [Bacteroidales bacterium]